MKLLVIERWDKAMPDVALSKEWSLPITTSFDTIVQAIGGHVSITAQIPPGIGIILAPHDAITIKSGVTFRVRSSSLGATLAVEVF